MNHFVALARVANAAVQAKNRAQDATKAADGSTHWSCRKMAAGVGLSKSTVIAAAGHHSPLRLTS